MGLVTIQGILSVSSQSDGPTKVKIVHGDGRVEVLQLSEDARHLASGDKIDPTTFRWKGYVGMNGKRPG